MTVDFLPVLRPARIAWNKGRIVGQKRPLLPRHVWSICVRLEMIQSTTGKPVRFEITETTHQSFDR